MEPPSLSGTFPNETKQEESPAPESSAVRINHVDEHGDTHSPESSVNVKRRTPIELSALPAPSHIAIKTEPVTSPRGKNAAHVHFHYLHIKLDLRPIPPGLSDGPCEFTANFLGRFPTAPVDSKEAFAPIGVVAAYQQPQNHTGTDSRTNLLQPNTTGAPFAPTLSFLPNQHQTNSGLLFLSEYDRHRVHIFSLDGMAISHFGKKGSSEGQFDWPVALAVSRDQQRLYVCDKNNHRVQVFGTFGNEQGKFLRQFGGKPPLLQRKLGSSKSDPGRLRYPYGVACSPTLDEVYVANTGNDRIEVFSETDGSYLRSFTYEHMEEPHGVAVSADGSHLFVSDYANHCIHVFSIADGQRIKRFGSEGVEDGYFGYPEGICAAPDNSAMYVCDWHNHRIQQFTIHGEFIRSLGGPAKSAGEHEFNEPTAVYILRDGTLLVTDAGNFRVQVLH